MKHLNSTVLSLTLLIISQLFNNSQTFGFSDPDIKFSKAFSKIAGGQNQYAIRSNDGMMIFDNGGFTIQHLRLNDVKTKSQITTGNNYKVTNIRVDFANSNSGAQLNPQNPTGSYSNYFFGNDPSKWETNVLEHNELYCSDVYKKIDVKFYSNKAGVKYDFIIKPGSRPENIEVKYSGINSLSIDGSGKLIVESEAGIVHEYMPKSYQVINGKEILVPVSYLKLSNNSIGFNIGNYDRTLALIIDPIIYSTFVGGLGDDYLWGGSMKKDVAGNIYFSGRTTSSGFPTTPGSFDITYNGGFDGFVMKMNASGTSPIFSTFIGGTGNDYAYSTAIDIAENIFVAGVTTSTNFPTTVGAYQTSKSLGDDGFIFKLNPAGNALIFASYLGGLGNDYVRDMAIDDLGNSYIITETTGSFPTTIGAYSTTYNGGPYDGALTKMNATGSALIYSSYLGSSDDDNPSAVAVDANYNAYVTGFTSGTGFPTTVGAYDQTYNGGLYDCFVTKFNVAGTGLVYSTFIGGPGNDQNWNTASLNAANEMLIGGFCAAGFPTTAGAFSTVISGSTDGFIAKLNSTGSALVFSTYLGGSNADQVYHASFAQTGNIFVTGNTSSSNFPIRGCAVDSTYNGLQDAFVSVFDSNASSLLYSTFLGGSQNDRGAAIIGDGNFAYVLGETGSSNFPSSTGAFDETYNGGNYDVFLTKIDIGGNTIANFTSIPSVCVGSTVSFINTSIGTTTFSWDFGNGNFSSSANPSQVYTSAGVYVVTLTANGPCGSNVFSQNITVNPLPNVVITALNPVCFNTPPFQLTNASPVGGVYSGTGISAGIFNPSVAGPGSHAYVYSVTDTNGCSANNSSTIVVLSLPVVSFNLPTSVCLNSGSIIMNATPIGGSFAGPGVSGSTFDPMVAGIGTHSITYSFTDQFGCSASGSSSITVSDLPLVSLAAFPAVCIDNGNVSLTGGLPIGGTYSGTGVTGSNFDPSAAGAGVHQITYTFVNASGCTGSDFQNITVNTIPIVTLAAVLDMCIDAQPIQLNGTPIGGSYSGSGVSGTSFNPSVAGSGLHQIVYSFIDNNGCSSSASINIQVNALPVVSTTNYGSIDISFPSVILSGGLPLGGVYSGTGVIGNIFYPSVAGIGVHSITYTYTNEFGCIGLAIETIEVTQSLLVTLDPFNNICMNSGPLTLIGGSPVGGTYSGSFVSGGLFDPAISGTGTFTITYTLNGQSASQTITVDPIPIVSVSVQSSISCAPNTIYIGYGPQTLLLTASTITGVSYQWYLDGVQIPGASNSTYSAAGAGMYSVIVTDANGCTSDMSGSGTAIYINSIDVRCGHNLDKVLLCHYPPGNNGNPQSICISPNAVQAHLDNHPGDCLGVCNSSSKVEVVFANMDLHLSPNPATEFAVLSIIPFYSSNFSVELYDIEGRLVIELHKGKFAENHEVEINIVTKMLNSGFYFVTLKTDQEIITSKLIITK